MSFAINLYQAQLVALLCGQGKMQMEGQIEMQRNSIGGWPPFF